MLLDNRLAVAAVLALGAVACGDDDDPITPPLNQETTFTVLIENVSTADLLPTARANGTVPLSPGVWIVYDGTNPLFTVGSEADEGTEAIAEDGNNAPEAAAFIVGATQGTFEAPGGSDPSPILGAGESVTFTITASPGDRLQIETMFAQSNDWFYGLGDNGLALFTGNTPISGDVTSSVVLYDAGTEEDEEPGLGTNQAPAQAGPNTGPTDDDPLIRVASGFTIPPAASVIRITITPQQ
jgi:hypothetical protein